MYTCSIPLHDFRLIVLIISKQLNRNLPLEQLLNEAGMLAKTFAVFIDATSSTVTPSFMILSFGLTKYLLKTKTAW